MRTLALVLALLAVPATRAQDEPPLRGYADWQAHPAKHVAFPWFKKTRARPGRAARRRGPDAPRGRLGVGLERLHEHSRPDPDRPRSARTLELDRIGLAHSGLLPQHWQRLREAGYDLDPLQRSLEQVLQVWARARASRPE